MDHRCMSRVQASRVFSLTLLANSALLLAISAGCCCTPTGCSTGFGELCGPPGAFTGCDAACSQGCDGGCGPQMPGLLAGLASCKGACGEVYVDEWINEPPVADQCGYDCGGCGQCRSCRPLLTTLKRLWGRPYYSSCDTSFLCGGPSCGCGSCDTGCESGCDGGCTSCQASGHDTFEHETIMPYDSNMIPGGTVPNSTMPYSTAPQAPMEVVPPSPSVTPTPAPAIDANSVQRINPAQQRRFRTASVRTR